MEYYVFLIKKESLYFLFKETETLHSIGHICRMIKHVKDWIG